MQRKIASITPEALSRFNVIVQTDIKRDINGGRDQFDTEMKRE